MRKVVAVLAVGLLPIITACDGELESPAALAPEATISRSTTTTVTDDELINASNSGSSIVLNDTDFQALVDEFETRATNAGIDMDNPTDSVKENLQTILGYSDSEWNTLLSGIDSGINSTTTQVPELTWESYDAKADEVIASEDDMPLLEGQGKTPRPSEIPGFESSARLERHEHAAETDFNDPEEYHRQVGQFNVNDLNGPPAAIRVDSCSDITMIDGPLAYSSSSCLGASAWFVGSTFGTAVAATACGGGNILACGSMLFGAAAMVRTGRDAWNACVT